MKKILIPILLIILLAVNVFAWGATRTVSGNSVTVTIDETGGTGIFTLQETVSGATISTSPSNCGKVGSILTCDSDDSTKRVITYQTTGTGTVSGVIVGGYPSTSSAVTGDTTIPKATACTAADWTSTDGACQSSNTLTRTWTKTNTACTGGVTHPPTESVACTYSTACTAADWTSTDGACQSSNTLTRTWTKTNAACTGGVTHPPTESVACTYSTGQTLGAQIDSQLTDAEKIQTTWTPALISRIANILRGWFS